MQDLASDLNFTAKYREYTLSNSSVSIVRLSEITHSLPHTHSKYRDLSSEMTDHFTTDARIGMRMAWSWTNHKLSRSDID